ncbi:uncharacterized protein LOC128743184 [Sabethes cyaneus]|uniref:uncharacterized protein LOC128743184 n=1 Tax=Sabethes cyaneus TaxID=53552 RepID=UPI00237DBB35|nr:uncharacterized protein LOC128743184 [Sabethes cyaneus]
METNKKTKTKKMTSAEVSSLINARITYNEMFVQKSYDKQEAWRTIQETSGLRVFSIEQLKVKWNNLSKKYKKLVALPTDDATEAGELKANSWVHFDNMHKFMSTQHSCYPQLVVNDFEPVRCGFCGSFFHFGLQYCELNECAHKELFTEGKAIFICATCKIDLNGRSIRTYVADKLKCVPDQPMNAALSNQNSRSIRTYVADKLKCEPDLLKNAASSNQFQQLVETVRSLSNKVDRLMQNRADQISKVTSLPELGVKRRRTEGSVRDSADYGTSTIEFTDLSVTSITPTPSPVKWWLYLSGFHPAITNADVTKIVSRCLDLDEDNAFDVIRLVSKGTDSSNLPFVSYKIGLDPRLKQLALTASSWPTGLLFREF